MEFKNRLRELRESKGLTQKELANELNNFKYDKLGKDTSNIYTQTVSYWENGREPNLFMLIKLGQYFDVPVDYLIGNSDCKDLNEIDFNTCLDILNKENFDKMLSPLSPDMKSAFYRMFELYISNFGLTDVHYSEDPSAIETSLDSMYLITQITDVLDDFTVNIFNALIEKDKNNNYVSILKDNSDPSSIGIPVDYAVEVNDIVASTNYKLYRLVNDLLKITLYNLTNHDKKIFFKDKILKLSDHK